MLKYLVAVLLSFFLSDMAYAGEKHSYQDGDTALEGYYEPSKCKTAKGTFLIIHQWMGLTENEKMRARLLSENCFNAFAVDMYGASIRPKNKKEASAQSRLYKTNNSLARSRLFAALNEVQKFPNVDAEKIGVMGYCFGGTMALDFARAGADLKTAISFHGGLRAPTPANAQTLKAEIIVHHGGDDPFVKPKELAGFQQEMAAAKARLSFYQYPNAVHAFTQKEAGSDVSSGAAYNAAADKKSWERTLHYLNTTFPN